MNDKQLIRIVLAGLISEGWKVYGDNGFGFKFCKGSRVFNLDKVVQSNGSKKYEEAHDLICDFCNKNVSGGHEHWPK